MLKQDTLVGQASRFLIVGLCSVAVDLIVYRLLASTLPIGVAKSCGFIGGTCVSYLVNKHWTFKRHQQSFKELVSFGILYMSSLGANVATNQRMLAMTSHHVLLSFLVATGVSTVINFTGQRWWVFGRKPVSRSQR
ncbi:GtrA family protein [bacterium]|nr:GtrA family protein [bacterium]